MNNNYLSNENQDIAAIFRRIRISHPSDQDLRFYVDASSQLDEFLKMGIETHLSFCPTCGERLVLFQEIRETQTPAHLLHPELLRNAKKMIALKPSPFPPPPPKKEKTPITTSFFFLSRHTVSIGVRTAPAARMNSGKLGDKLDWSYREDGNLNFVIRLQSEKLAENHKIQMYTQSKDEEKILKTLSLKRANDKLVFVDTLITRSEREKWGAEDIFIRILEY